MLMSVLFLTACGDRASVIPDELMKPVAVNCPPGYTSAAFGECLFLHVEALAVANDKLGRIRDLEEGRR